MKILRLPWWPVLAGVVALTASSGVPAHASTRNYLTVEGRVSDHLGTPLPGTWVYCLGSRRGSVAVDSLGTYRLEIPGATLEELGRSPLKIRIQARRKGYRFALSNGAPELGLEMRVVKDDSPLSRLRVSSNDSSTVAAVANSVVLDANPRALLTAMFVGSQGAQYETPPVPLGEEDVITLAGDAQSIPELAVAEPLPSAPGTRPASGASSAPAAAGPTATPGAPSGTTATPAVKPGTASSTTATPAAASTAEPKPLASGTPDPRAKESGKPPSGSSPPRTGTPPPTPSPRPKDTTATARIGADTDAPSDPSLRPVLHRQLPTEPVTPGPQPPTQQVPTAPGIPPLTRHGPGSGPSTAVPMCDCTIRGTVEVQWDRPLSSRTEVVIAVEDAPDATTSAELFMGSPRAFEIHPAPCGVHKLLLWTRSKQRFVLVSSEPRVVCTPRGLQQMRLVLEPVARWGTPQ